MKKVIYKEVNLLYNKLLKINRNKIQKNLFLFIFLLIYLLYNKFKYNFSFYLC